MPEPVQPAFNGPVDKVEKPVVNDATVASIQHSNGGDPDAQAMLIGSLRSQIQDLFSQVTQLNNKLVQSYDRVSDLEDNLHVASANVRQSSVKISQLELERTQHLAALNTGLLVEKSHVTAELTRLMEKATEEAAQRGQAETARADIEKDLDDLSATLFHQANTMVAEARFARAQSERKVEDAELALKGAEEAVAMMQQQMQEMQAEKETSQKSAEEMRALMGKGKWVEKVNGASSPLVRLRSSHTPYQEFLLFVAHLRTIRPTSTSPPAMSTLLPLPFLARIMNEDSEPTVRLDLAPSLNWLSRRSVLTAINTGQLTIEPMSSANFLQESALAQLSNANVNICCALCGMPIFQYDGGSHSYSRPPPHPLSRTSSSINSFSRSTNLFFKKPLSYSATNSANSSPPASPRRSSYGSPPSQQVYIFRLASTGSSSSNLGVAMLPTSIAPSHSAPSTSTSSQSHYSSQTLTQQQARNSQSTIYPLCTSGWCLMRLRSTCSLWAFVRTGVIEKVWEEEVPALPASVPSKPAADRSSRPESVGLGKPPIPPRRRGLWGMASALGERAASWGGESDKDKGRASPSTPEKEVDRRLPPKLPAPPPSHPASPSATSKRPGMSSPPPLPKRSEGRGRTRSATVSRAATASPVPTVAAPVVEEESTPIINGHLPANDAGVPNVEKSKTVDAPAPPEASSSATIDEARESKEQVTTQPLPVDGQQSTSTANKTVSNTDLISPFPSPSIDKRNSQDSFASAASEIRSSEASSPPAPAHAATQEVVIPPPGSPKGQSSNPPTQANTTSGNAAHNDVNKAVPSSTAPAAPPPLPRRAAARARSMIPPAPPADPIENAAEVAEIQDTSSTQAVSDGTAAAQEATANPPIAAPESSELSNETTETALESTEPAPGNLSEQQEPTEDTKTSAVNGKYMDHAGTERVSTPPPMDEKLSDVPSSPTGTILGNRANGVVGDSTVAVPSQAGEGADSEVYVADTTWEERTWKELVKLKEDMFWARIGGLR